MKFYYEIEYMNGSQFGGHNCACVRIVDDVLILEGFDLMCDFEGDYNKHYWWQAEKLIDIKSFKFERMEE